MALLPESDASQPEYLIRPVTVLSAFAILVSARSGMACFSPSHASPGLDGEALPKAKDEYEAVLL